MILIHRACYTGFMNKVGILLISGIFILLVSACQSSIPVPPVMTTSALENTDIPVETAISTTSAASTSSVPVSWKLEVVAENLYVPWSLVFTSPDRMLVTERSGTIREIVNGELRTEPVYQFNDIAAQDEAGLMGMAIDPAYLDNNYLYACYTYQQDGSLFNRVVRLRDGVGQITLDGTVIEQIPSASNHAGCRLAFAPDGTLFVTAGDALQPEKAQDITSLAGKILRVNSDGSIPQDNPFPNSPVYSLGHRNPQGLDWDLDSGLLYATEHGPSGFDGAPGGDEINLIQAGGNYGWPLVSHEESMEGMISPLIVFTPAEAPAAGMFYSGSVFSQYAGDFFFGALRGEGLVRVRLLDGDPREIIEVEKIIDTVGRIREVVEGPDGYIYFTTSNRDGRGTLNSGDDRIYRLIPQ